MSVNLFDILKRHKKDISAKYHVKKIGIFGSYAKGLENEESDVDILVEFEYSSFDNFMDLSFYLEDLFHKKVDLLTPNSLSPFMKASVKKEVLWV